MGAGSTLISYRCSHVGADSVFFLRTGARGDSREKESHSKIPCNGNDILFIAVRRGGFGCLSYRQSNATYSARRAIATASCFPLLYRLGDDTQVRIEKFAVPPPYDDGKSRDGVYQGWARSARSYLNCRGRRRKKRRIYCLSIISSIHIHDRA